MNDSRVYLQHSKYNELELALVNLFHFGVEIAVGELSACSIFWSPNMRMALTESEYLTPKIKSIRWFLNLQPFFGCQRFHLGPGKVPRASKPEALTLSHFSKPRAG